MVIEIDPLFKAAGAVRTLMGKEYHTRGRQIKVIYINKNISGLIGR